VSTGSVAADLEVIEAISEGQRWAVTWHPSGPPPDGTPHGSSAVCVTPDGLVVLVSEDGVTWQLPGGRPEVNEDWRATLDREVLEEACATVGEATLLGFARSTCLEGRQQGEVLVRAFWRARVTLHEWAPEWETRYRAILAPAEAGARTAREFAPIYRRIFVEALGASIRAGTE
jgi:ADP-ribose pyrophosphatase YjhB (NUDIX family)